MLKLVKTTTATVLLFAIVACPAFGQDPAPQWPDGTVGLGSTPGAEGYWQVRPGAGGGSNPLNIPGPVNPRAVDVPLQPWARALYEYRQNEFTQTNFPPTVRCKPGGGPAFWNSPGFDIVQVPDLDEIYIVNIAGPHSWRVVYMDGREHPEDLRPTYLGHSVGRWEEDTLVIDTVGFNEKTWIRGSYPTTKQLHVIERIARPALDFLTYRVTIDDPGAYTEPWDAGGWNNSRWLAGGEMFEYICQDNRF
jgi:hypothetical protein